MDRDSLASVGTALSNIAGIIAEVQRQEGQGSTMDAATIAAIKHPIARFLSHGW
jgi:hypothetical protein